MKTIGLYDAKTNLSSLIAELEETKEPILLTRHGKVVAQITVPNVQTSPKRGCLKSPHFSIADDFDQVDVGFDLDTEPFVYPESIVAEGETPYNTEK